MSRQIALDAIHLRPTARPAHTEYVCHPQLLRAVTGLDPERPETALECQRRFYEAWEVDLLWCTHDGPIDWAAHGRVTDMGHAIYYPDGRDWRLPKPCPFEDVEEVWAFDPVAEYGLPDFGELVRFYEDFYQAQQANFPEQLIPGGYYKTIVSGAIQAFGWDMLLLAAADQERFAAVLARFANYTMHYVKAWARTSIEVFIQHDDMVWTEGPFMHPEFYRRAIFPHYRAFWAELKAAGKKVLFCSDGTYEMFMEDLAACGADGFIFEPSNNLDAIVRKFGRTHCLVGSKVDCRTMAFRGWEAVQAEIDATLPLARECPGFIWAVGNHIPANVPVEIAQRYMDYLRAHWGR
jgi:hypothetical protein